MQRASRIVCARDDDTVVLHHAPPRLIVSGPRQLPLVLLSACNEILVVLSLDRSSASRGDCWEHRLAVGSLRLLKIVQEVPEFEGFEGRRPTCLVFLLFDFSQPVEPIRRLHLNTTFGLATGTRFGPGLRGSLSPRGHPAACHEAQADVRRRPSLPLPACSEHRQQAACLPAARASNIARPRVVSASVRWTIKSSVANNCSGHRAQSDRKKWAGGSPCLVPAAYSSP